MKRTQLMLLLERRRSWLEGAGWALSLIGFVSFAAFVWESIVRDGGAAYDLHAYVLAGRNLLDGTPFRPSGASGSRAGDGRHVREEPQLLDPDCGGGGSGSHWRGRSTRPRSDHAHGVAVL